MDPFCIISGMKQKLGHILVSFTSLATRSYISNVYQWVSRNFYVCSTQSVSFSPNPTILLPDQIHGFECSLSSCQTI